MRRSWLRIFTAVGALAGAACASGPTVREGALPPSERTQPVATGGEPASFLEREPQTSARRSVPRIGTIRGEVVELARDRIEIIGRTLAGPPAELTLFVGGVTKVTIDGRAASFGQLQPGMDVKASYTQNHSTIIADKIAASGIPVRQPVQ